MSRSWIFLLVVASWTSCARSTAPNTAGGDADTVDASTGGDTKRLADAGE